MPRQTPRGERGFTLIELLLAMALMSIGVAATLSVFGASGRTTALAQQTNVASQQAQAELDRMSEASYASLGMTSTPASSANTRNPGYRVSGTTLQIRTGVSESFVLSSDSGQAGAAISPTPLTFAIGTGDATVTGKIYRFVTWRDENCPTGICDGTQNTKRVTVAATVDAHGTLAARAPVWLSRVIPDPNALPPGSSLPPDTSGPTESAQDFYLYDTRCGSTARVNPTASHTTHNTAATGSTAAQYSVCENATSSGVLQPDLMAKDDPTGTSSTPLYTYSTDLTGAYSGGLAMKRQGTSCQSSYLGTNATNVSTPNQWSVHSWASNTFASAFVIEGQVTLSFFSETLGGAAGRGFICVTLLDRSVSSGVPTNTAIASSTYDIASWPTDLRRLTTTFNLPPASPTYTIPAGHRLMLAISVRSESANDLVFFYDHPLYPSFLEVATSTPF